MKQREFERELNRRLEENRQLVEHPLLPGRLFGVANVVGRHLFSIVVVVALVMAGVMTLGFPAQLKWVNAVMLFLK